MKQLIFLLTCLSVLFVPQGRFAAHVFALQDLSALLLRSETSPDDIILSIPRLQIETTLFEMELRPRQGTVEWYISPWERRAGHLEGTALPGQHGNIVIGAHAEMVNGEPGLFARLQELKTGYVIRLKQANQIYRYRVSDIKIVAFDDLSVVTSPQNRLTLITCNGDYDPEQRGYATRLVVIADPIPENKIWQPEANIGTISNNAG